MPDTTEVKKTSEYVKLLEESGILRDDELRVVRGMAQETVTAKMLARRLVAKGILTRWQAGQLLAGWTKLRLGKHKLCRQIGRSEFGRVFLAEHIQLRREVAIKTLSRRYTQSKEIADRFLDDARSAATLDHHNLAHVLDIDSADNQFYVVMEYVVGQDLQRLVADAGPLPPEQAAAYLCQAADGLHYAHQAGLVHQDICPANIMLDEKGVIKVLGLGVGPLADSHTASELHPDDESSDRCGDFRAPERRGNQQPGDVRSDIYSLGCTAGFLLTGQPPCGELDREAAEHPLTEEEAYRDEFLRRDLPADLVDILQTMIAVDPAQRFATAEAVRAALSTWLDHQAQATPSLDLGLAGGTKRPVPPPVPDQFEVVTQVPKPSLPTKGENSSHGSTTTSPNRRRQGIAAGVVGACLLVATAYFLIWPRRSTPIAMETSRAATRQALPPSNPAKPVRKPELRRRPSAPQDRKSKQSEASTHDASDGGATTNSTAKKIPNAGDMKKESGNGTTPQAPKAEIASKKPAASEPRPKVPVKPARKEPSAKKPTAVPPLVVENPLRNLPKTVDLLTTEPVDGVIEIGPVNPAAIQQLQVTLLGGEHAIGRSGHFSLQAERRPSATWTFLLHDDKEANGKGLPIAHLDVHDGTLRLSWDNDADAHTSATQLSNCVLRITAKKHVHDLRLRSVKEVEPLIVNLKKPSISERFLLLAPPDPHHVRFEVAQLGEPFPSTYNLKPVAPVIADGDTVTVQIGSDEVDDHVLFLELAPQLRSTFRLDCKVFFQVSPLMGRAPLTQKTFDKTAMLVARKQNIDNHNAQIARSARNGFKRLDVKRRANAKKKVDLLEKKLEETSKATTCVEVIRALRKSMADGAPLHFRLYYLAGDCEVDLLRSTIP